MKNSRKSYNRQRIASHGNVWTVTAKANPENMTLKVSRVEGNVTDLNALNSALRHFAASVGMTRLEYSKTAL